jgi:hypothetical protein
MNDVPKVWEPNLHDILHSLNVSSAKAEFLADQIERADPRAAAVFRKFAEELRGVWNRYYPLMPTNKDIYLALNSPDHDSQFQDSKGNAGN